MEAARVMRSLGICLTMVLVTIAGPQAEWAQSEFEVASIHPVFSGGRPIPCQVNLRPPSLPARVAGDRLELRNETLEGLIMAAYDVRRYQFGGLPGWADCRDQYEITAKVSREEKVTDDRLRAMLQSLLADRFQLKLRRESRTFPVYELTIAKKGVKVRLVPDRTASAHDPWTILPLVIEGFLDLPVVDKTGLTGFIPNDAQEWDTSELREEVKHGGKPAVSIFHDVEAQLGLSLKKTTQIGDFLVIEQVQRPSEN
jgi:hypothetical protein